MKEKDLESLPIKEGISTDRSPDIVSTVTGKESEQLAERDTERKIYRLLSTKPIRDEFILPALLWITVDLMHKEEGLVLREDVLDNLQTSMALIVKDRGPFDQQKLFRYSMLHGQRIIKAMNADTTREAVLGISFLIQKLADEGILKNPDSQAVLTATVCLGEARDDGKGGPWGWNPDRISKVADNAYQHALHCGYF